MRFLLPVMVVLIMTIQGLSGYEKPVFSAPERGSSWNFQDLLPQGGGDGAAVTAQTENADEETEEETEAIEESQVPAGSIGVPDGTYEGSATGYGGPIRVRVTVADGKMTDITILSASGEDPAFLNRAKRVIESMINGQTTDVDTVSEATYSSRGIISAVKNALYQTKDTNTKAAASSSNSSKKAKKPKKVKEDATYKDGVYTGSAQGFGGLIKVQVTIKKGKITKIKILSASGEGDSFLRKAETLIPKIIKKQSTNVDTVSGATFSSTGLINAVRNALSKAEKSSKSTSSKKKKKKSSEKETTAAQKQTEKETQETPAPQVVDESEYADGTYTGTGEGFDGPLKVRVTIKSGKITAAELIETEDTEPYITNASEILKKIVATNSTDVDVVAGATFSSKGILAAVADALDQSKKAKSGETDDGKEETSAEETSPVETTAEETTAEETSAEETSPEESTSETESEDEETESSSEETSAASKYIDGTYKVSAMCIDVESTFDNYEITAKVTIQNDKIVSITDVTGDDDEDNQAYLSRAVKRIVPKITAAGTTDGVDVVSGSTCSSKAILELCKEAFEKAKR